MGQDDSTAASHHHSRIQRSPRWKAFRIGKLHFGLHGLLGMSSIFLTGMARQFPSRASILVLSQMSTAVLVHQAASLLNQVPISTTIIPGVTAPHKEAFKRTMAAMQYLVVRVCLQWTQNQSYFHTADVLLNTYYVPLAILLFFFYPLVPSIKAEWLNGNTWIFVVPIFAGIAGDVYQYVAWGDCVTTPDLLLGQLLGLFLAFGFTLGFRNYIPMSVVYLAAAVAVWRIIQEGIVSINNQCQAN